MGVQLILGTVLVGLAAYLVVVRRLRALIHERKDDVHRLPAPVRPLETE